MGSNVKVWDIGYQGDGWCNEDPEGNYVEVSDYRALEAERDALKDKVDELATAFANVPVRLDNYSLTAENNDLKAERDALRAIVEETIAGLEKHSLLRTAEYVRNQLTQALTKGGGDE